MFEKPVYLGAIELGTSQVNVLVGRLHGDKPEIIGRGSASSNGAVVKGGIRDMDRAVEALDSALCQLGEEVRDLLYRCSEIMLIVSGSSIESIAGVGSATIRNEQRIVTDVEQTEARNNALVLELEPGRRIIGLVDTFWQIDRRRVSNPDQQRGNRLECHELIVHGKSSEIDNFTNVLHNYGIEECNMEMIYAPLACQKGIVSDAESDNGIVLIDLGAGTADYLVAFDGGIYDAGTLPIGFEHVANDLSIGLELPIDACRKLFEHGTLAQAREAKAPFLNFELATGGRREIPISSFDTIIDVRLREVFSLIKRRIERNGTIQSSFSGILTGGGALYPESSRIFGEVFEFSTRIGSVADATGAVTGIDSPRYSAVWGALKVAADFYCAGNAGKDGWLDRSIDSLNHLWGGTFPKWKNLGKAFRF